MSNSFSIGLFDIHISLPYSISGLHIYFIFDMKVFVSLFEDLLTFLKIEYYFKVGDSRCFPFGVFDAGQLKINYNLFSKIVNGEKR